MLCAVTEVFIELYTVINSRPIGIGVSLAGFNTVFYFTEMASHLKIVFVTCLLLFILMEEFKPVLAKKGEQLKQRTKKLETSMVELKAKIKALEKCKGKWKRSARS